MIRPSETRELTAEGASLEEIVGALLAQTPEGWQLTHKKVTMPKGTTKMVAVGRAARWGDVQEIEAADLTALRAAVPDGWQLLNVRNA
ncbi:hypothetical protein K5S26_07735 [Microbacterium marinilacus]|nr:hypothetical protein [Microbacterium marinilacus]